MTDRGSPSRGSGRWLLVALALAVAAAVWLDFVAFQRDREEFEARLGQPVIAERLGEVDPSLRRASDLDRVRSRLAMALVQAELGSRGVELPGAQQEAVVARLRAARELAAEALVRRPALADAAAALGASTYLQWVHAEDRRLFAEASSWEGALQLGRELAPAQDESSKLLATAYLELWPVLSPEKQVIARDLLGTVFGDSRYLSLLVGPWLEIAENRAEALEPIPDRSASWEVLSRVLAERGDWAGYLETEERRRRALRIELETELAEAARLRRLGATGASRELYDSVLARAEPGQDSLELAARVLGEAPPGTRGNRVQQHAGRWLDWALDRCLHDHCPFDEATLDRLAGFAPEADPAREALLSIYTGRPEEGERIARRQVDLTAPEWLPYLVAKSRWLRGRGELEAARAALEQVGPSGAESSLYWQERLRVDQVRDDQASIERARRRLSELATREAPAAAWQPSENGEATLSIFLDRPATSFRLEVSGPVSGAAFDLRIDGEPVGVYVVSGTAEVAIDRALPAGSHTLRLIPRLRAHVAPGAVRLESSRPARNPVTGIR